MHDGGRWEAYHQSFYPLNIERISEISSPMDDGKRVKWQSSQSITWNGCNRENGAGCAKEEVCWACKCQWEGLAPMWWASTYHGRVCDGSACCDGFPEGPGRYKTRMDYITSMAGSSSEVWGPQWAFGGCSSWASKMLVKQYCKMEWYSCPDGKQNNI